MRASAIALLVSACMAGDASRPDAGLGARPAHAPGLGASSAAPTRAVWPTRPERLDLLLQVFGGYDDDVLAEQSGRTPSQAAAGELRRGVWPPAWAPRSRYSRPGLLFNRPQGKGDFKAFVDSSFRYYPAPRQPDRRLPSLRAAALGAGESPGDVLREPARGLLAALFVRAAVGPPAGRSGKRPAGVHAIPRLPRRASTTRSSPTTASATA